jgi:flagellin
MDPPKFANQTWRFEMANVDVTRIAGNIGALNALNQLASINSQLATHQARLASGKQILSAADDPAGMSMATSFDVRRNGMATALKSIGDSKNLMSSVEGGLSKIQDILVKMRNKALEAQGSTIGDSEKQAIKSQLESFRSEINDIVSQTQWNGTNLIGSGTASGSTSSLSFMTSDDLTSGSASSTTSFKFEATSTANSAGSAGKIGDNQTFWAGDATSGSVASASGGLGLGGSNLDVTASGSASKVASTINSALDVVKSAISQVGSFTARLTFKEEALTVQQANTESAYNRIMNANMAQEQVEASKFSILQQTATAMLAQANAAPQFLLSLFR